MRHGGALDELIASKKGDRKIQLTAGRNAIRTRYAEYAKRRKLLETLPEAVWDVLLNEAMTHCYRSTTAPLEKIKLGVTRPLSDHEIELCPYCLLRQPDAFDHFLPIARFPEFSAFAPNLVWACSRCNLAKGDRMIGPPRTIINPYFDKLPADEPLLYCAVDIVNGKAAITFHVPLNIEGVDVAILNLARQHCTDLNLFRLFRREASAILAGFLREIAARYPGGISGQRLYQEIQLEKVRLPLEAGVNYWAAALWDGILACDQFHDYVSQFVLANPPQAIVPQANQRQPAAVGWL